jgi:hypothetical protein
MNNYQTIIAFGLFILTCCFSKAEDQAKLGSLYCGTEYGSATTCYVMTIRKSKIEPDSYDVIWTLPWEDPKYFLTGKLKFIKNLNGVVTFRREFQNQVVEYTANTDSNGNLVGGTMKGKSGWEKGKWELFKVNTSPDCLVKSTQAK